MNLLARIEQWESAWSEYVSALEYYDLDWSGENFVIDIGNAGRRLKDAQNALRAIDADFCKSLGI